VDYQAPIGTRSIGPEPRPTDKPWTGTCGSPGVTDPDVPAGESPARETGMPRLDWWSSLWETGS
jgi:hypothetical protein